MKAKSGPWRLSRGDGEPNGASISPKPVTEAKKGFFSCVGALRLLRELANGAAKAILRLSESFAARRREKRAGSSPVFGRFAPSAHSARAPSALEGRRVDPYIHFSKEKALFFVYMGGPTGCMSRSAMACARRLAQTLENKGIFPGLKNRA